jgi:peptide/nickel transport system permease protein
MLRIRASGGNRVLSIRVRIATALSCIGSFYLAVLLAGFLAPYDPEVQNRDFPFAPPTRLHFVDASGHLGLRPFVCALRELPGKAEVYEEDCTRAIPVRFFLRDTGPFSRSGPHLFGVEPPGYLFLLGTDSLGRDQFSRLLYGGRISLFSGLLAGALSLGLALTLGAIAGFYGRWLDEIIMRGAELLLALPWLYCLLALRAFLPLDTSPGETLFLVVVVIGLRGWARPARLIRGVALSARERDYVLAARGFGASGFYLLYRHVLPQTFGVALTQAALLIPQYTLAEVALSFLGLGIGEPTASWGNMLANLQHYRVLASYWWMSLPGLILITIFLGYYVLANALHESFHIKNAVRLELSS